MRIAALSFIGVLCGLTAGCSSGSNDGSSGTTGGGGSQTSSAGGSSTAGAPSGGSATSGGTTGVGGSSSTGGGSSSGGSVSSGGSLSSGGSSSGGTSSGGTASGGTSSGGTGGVSTEACNQAGLTWLTANKTHYESYPDPGSPECIEYNGCTWAGQFATCDGVLPEEWVASHNIAALFPLGDYGLHDICIKSGDKTMVVTVYDTCGDSDCDGCCTENKGDKDALVDLEKYTDERWGLEDGAIEWADLGPTTGSGCD